MHTTLCDVNITIRDVNNHPPQFLQNNYLASLAENTELGKNLFQVKDDNMKSCLTLLLRTGVSILQVNATDLDTGVNAEVRYRIQQGSFDDFAINNRTGVVSVARKLDYDKRNTYQMEIVAADQGRIEF